MIDTGKYENYLFLKSQREKLNQDAPKLLAEVKRLREENDRLHTQRVQISWIQEARGGQSKAFELLAEVKRLRMIVARLEDARIESASMYDRPKLFHAVREIYEQRLQDIYQEKREEE